MIGSMQHTLTTDAVSLSLPFAEALNRFARDLVSRDLAEATQLAYTTDVRQFLMYLSETTVTADRPEKISKPDMTEYLSYLAEQSVSGVTRRRKLAALREFFRFLPDAGIIAASPAAEQGRILTYATPTHSEARRRGPASVTGFGEPSLPERGGRPDAGDRNHSHDNSGQVDEYGQYDHQRHDSEFQHQHAEG
jgi:hypothetical protein